MGQISNSILFYISAPNDSKFGKHVELLTLYKMIVGIIEICKNFFYRIVLIDKALSSIFYQQNSY